jgi:hypothetical protein
MRRRRVGEAIEGEDDAGDNGIQPMEQFAIVRYVHASGMPSTEGAYERDRDQAMNKALDLSKKHPDDWVRVETKSTVIGSFFRGSEVFLYLAP